jgi:hypothetical protein
MMADARADGTIARRSDTLFGRGEQLAGLGALGAAGPTRLVCVVGAGGLGKTRLIEAFGQQLDDQGLPHGPIVDFYHVDSFRASAIEAGIVRALKRSAPRHAALFEPYFAAVGDLERARNSGSGFPAAQRQLREAFVASYNAFAAEAASAGSRVVLLFDTVEQAVELSDETEERLGLGQSSASAGGEHWLRAILPRLANTLVVVGGRPETLYGAPVSLYGDLRAQITGDTLELSGLDEAATAALARDMLARARASSDEQMVGIAATIDLDDPGKLRAWYLLSEGLPFWIAILFTLEFVGGEPGGVLSDLQDTVTALAPGDALGDEQREALRDRLRDYFLGEVSQAAPPIQVALQCMATVRKGLTPEILELVLARLGIVEPAAELFERLRSLAVVKARRARRYTSRGERPADRGDYETLLYLHDELYAWLDTHPFVTLESRQVVRDVVLNWYLGAIETSQAERLAASEALRYLRKDDPQNTAYELERDDAIRRTQQLQRDLLNYAYEGDEHGREQAAAHYQLFAYEAIFSRATGQETALHQEALRSLYRHKGALGPADRLAFGAVALLRAAVQSEDMALTRRLLEHLGSYDEVRGEVSGTTRALFELATAIARLYSRGGTMPEDRERIEQALDLAESIVEQVDVGELAPPQRQWRTLLQAQVHNFRGYLHRLNYELAAAIRAYRRAELVAHRSPGLLPQFRATTLNNLAFALSEQGETEEAKRIAFEALAIRQRHGTAFDVAFSRNVLARIALRSGEGARARQLAEISAEAMREVAGPRWIARSSPVLADAYRKEAELLDDSPGEQDALFERALVVLDEADEELRKLGASLGEAQREILQARGCVLRNWGLAQMRRGLDHRAVAKRHLSAGHLCLEQALEVARANNDPLIVQIDILEDLAAVHVYEDEYDHRLYKHLDEAEALAPPEYKVQEGAGPLEVADATRAYWRELGQCQLQRMLGAFGKFDFGEYRFLPEPAPGRREPVAPPGDERFVDEAAAHLVITMAYLCRYSRHSWMLNKARELTLRELLSKHTPAQIDRLSLAAYETAKRYGLLYDESFRVVEQVIGLARDNLGLAE